jgi:8-amino-7-oxononanoate synthase
MPDPLAWVREALDHLQQQHLRRELRQRTGGQAAEIALDGRTYRNFASNDYLGLCGDPRLANAAQEEAARTGWGSGASPLVTGRSRIHATCERALADFEGSEAALLFPSGFAANMGTIPALVGRGDFLFSDQANHASIIDGCRLSGAQLAIYHHADAADLRNLLAEAPSHGRRLIVTDSLFSMDGDLAPLAELAQLAHEFSAMLLVDEAHATGVLGPAGRGGCELAGIEDAVHVRVGTLSKALGSLGGYVAASHDVIAWLANRARSYVFSTAAPAPVLAAALEGLRIVRDEPQRREVLLRRASHLRSALRAQGWEIGSAAAQIIPLQLGDPAAATELAQRLQREGIWVPAIRPPSVPHGRSLLRISLSFLQDEQSIDALLQALARNR